MSGRKKAVFPPSFFAPRRRCGISASGKGSGLKKEHLFRGLFYLAGLGVSPIISVSYSVAQVTGLSFADMTLALYCLFVAVQMALHLAARRGWRALVMDALQIPLSVVFTRFLGVFSGLIPEFSTAYAGQFAGSLGGRVLVLAAAILLTGIGAAMSLGMRLVPNPGDGIVQAIADSAGWQVGFAKNCLDVSNVLLTVLIGLLCAGRPHAAGQWAGMLSSPGGKSPCALAFAGPVKYNKQVNQMWVSLPLAQKTGGMATWPKN